MGDEGFVGDDKFHRRAPLADKVTGKKVRGNDRFTEKIIFSRILLKHFWNQNAGFSDRLCNLLEKSSQIAAASGDILPKIDIVSKDKIYYNNFGSIMI